MSKNTQQKTTRRSNRRYLIWLFVILFIIVVGLSIYYFFLKEQPKKSISEIKNTTSVADNKQEKPTKEESKNISQDGTKEDEESGKTPKTPSQYEGEDINKLSRLTGVINYKGVNSDKLILRLTIDQLLHSGNCQLTITSASGKTVIKTANIEPGPSSSSCRGFDVPLDQLEKGEHKIKIEVTADNKTGIFEDAVTI